MQNQMPASKMKDNPYKFLFKPNSKRVRMEDQKQEELERKYQFLFQGYPSNHTYKVKDFNTFASQKIK
jgi:hypothetical protein